MSAHDDPIDNEWTPEEQSRLEALGEERRPGSALKARTLDTLSHRGLIRPERRISMSKVIGFALAASLVFAAGAIVGYSAAEHRATSRDEESRVALRQVARLDSVPPAAPARHVVWY